MSGEAGQIGSHTPSNSVISIEDQNPISSSASDGGEAFGNRTARVGDNAVPQSQNQQHKTQYTPEKLVESSPPAGQSPAQLEAECLQLLSQSTESSKAREILHRVVTPKKNVYLQEPPSGSRRFVNVGHQQITMQEVHQFLTAVQKEKSQDNLERLLDFKSDDLSGSKAAQREARTALFIKAAKDYCNEQNISAQNPKLGWNTHKFIEKVQELKTNKLAHPTDLAPYSQAGLLSCKIETPHQHFESLKAELVDQLAQGLLKGQTNHKSILKQKDIAFLNMIHSSDNNPLLQTGLFAQSVVNALEQKISEEPNKKETLLKINQNINQNLQQRGRYPESDLSYQIHLRLSARLLELRL